MNTTLTSIQEDAQSWANLQSQMNYLNSLSSSGKLNDEQMDFISEYSHYIGEKIENFEAYLLDDISDKYYEDVRKVANTLSDTPSDEFINNVQSNLSEMNMDDKEFHIKKAVDKYNSFYYSCSIIINSFGYVSFVGCHSESNASATVLFNKKDKRRVTVKDVKDRIAKIKIN